MRPAHGRPGDAAPDPGTGGEVDGVAAFVDGSSTCGCRRRSCARWPRPGYGSPHRQTKTPARRAGRCSPSRSPGIAAQCREVDSASAMPPTRRARREGRRTRRPRSRHFGVDEPHQHADAAEGPRQHHADQRPLPERREHVRSMRSLPSRAHSTLVARAVLERWRAAGPFHCGRLVVAFECGSRASRR
mgnify:CR=1 FL=1